MVSAVDGKETTVSDVFVPAWLPTTVGSVPLEDVRQAWRWVISCLPQIPAWPQLTRRTYRENMYAQFSERFPGVVVDTEAERTYVGRPQDLEHELERLYLAYLQYDIEYGEISRAYAEGLHYLLGAGEGEEEVESLDRSQLSPVAVKGQVTGPISWGLVVTDRNRRPLLYDEILAEAISKHLRLKATWQEQQLKTVHPQTIMYVDEPYMSSFGSGFVQLSREQVITLLGEVLDGIDGLKGVHCCANTDWSVLLETSVDILSLDAYEYAESLALYPEAVAAFLDRGGIIAWGIVPAGPLVEGETATSLVDRLHEAMDLLVQKGVSLDKILAAGLVMPSCGTGSLDPNTAQRVHELTAQVSAEMRSRYVASDATPSDAA
jgi:hypothetical protein